ncbi:MAG: helix-turn-helix transcriptional regulator [Clostridia bacterium]|nr:helix-turn-helix transcriptional regulator [Clostridia bacterium]
MPVLRLKELREEFQVTQKRLSEYLHIKQNTYSQYENEQRQLPLEALIALAEYYDVSTDYILGLTDVDAPYPRKK